jgi:hypothetical protein
MEDSWSFTLQRERDLKALAAKQMKKLQEYRLFQRINNNNNSVYATGVVV